ncbi:MAG: hypothetical protein LBU39_08445 [Desulfobulbaceae bacterium]|jgi:hypothetical protein|nr:hypothetical protein [Desulfobulbaceae bacterium]
MISGNVGSQTFTSESVSTGDSFIHAVKCAGNGAVWPRGAVLIRATAAGNYAPLATLPADDGYLLAVLNDELETTTETTIGATAVVMGGVKLAALTVGGNAPSVDVLFALERQRIFPR